MEVALLVSLLAVVLIAVVLIAADDAIRAQSVHSVSGSGIAVELVWLSTIFFWLAQSDE